MDGLTTSELLMIRRLAGNDEKVRKKTIKNLRKWLTAILSRVPDTLECRDLIENNFLRVWKALFYCMWMADKPLPQEQLAEQISSLIEIFSSKSHVMNLFIECFFRTIAREWQGIDRLRLDKMMLLVRRFLRKSLTGISEMNWDEQVLDRFLQVIKVFIFNHHPKAVKKSKAPVASPATAPLGLQIHVVDIFLEELAKVGGGENLSSNQILTILDPFIHELCTNDDERLTTEIQERIFRHLMRQSDVGIDYAEGVLGDIDEDGEGEEEDDENSESDADMENEQDKSSGKKKSKRNDNNKNDDEDEDDYLNMDESSLSVQVGPFDPRAGAVDVILPQLEIDYKELSEKLIEVGGAKEVKMKNRKMLYKLAKKFQKLIEGEYPLAIEVEDTRKPAIDKKEIKKATERLIELEESAANPDRKNRKPKKVRKKLAQQKMELEMEGSENEDETSIDLDESQLLNDVTGNYANYIDELHQEEDSEAENEASLNEEEEEIEEKPLPTKNKAKKTKELKRKSEETDKNIKKKKKKETNNIETVEVDNTEVIEDNEVTLTKSKSKAKKSSKTKQEESTVDKTISKNVGNGNEENLEKVSSIANTSSTDSSPTTILKAKNKNPTEKTAKSASSKIGKVLANIASSEATPSTENPKKRKAATEEKILKKASKYVKLSRDIGEEGGGGEEEEELDLKELSVPTINLDLTPKIKLRKPRWDEEKRESTKMKQQEETAAVVKTPDNDSKSKLKKKKKNKKKKGDQLPSPTVEQKHEAEALKFLQTWNNNRDQWKFEKLKQVWLIKNAFNPTAINDEHFNVFANYVRSVHGKARKDLEQDTKKVIKNYEEHISQRLISKPSPDEMSKYERARQIIQMLNDD